MTYHSSVDRVSTRDTGAASRTTTVRFGLLPPDEQISMIVVLISAAAAAVVAALLRPRGATRRTAGPSTAVARSFRRCSESGSLAGCASSSEVGELNAERALDSLRAIRRSRHVVGRFMT